MKQPTLDIYVCGVCAKVYAAMTGSRVTCAHADTFARLRPAAVAKPTTQPTEAM